MNFQISFHPITTVFGLLTCLNVHASSILVDVDFDTLTPGTSPPTSGVTGPGALPNTNLVESLFGTQVVTTADSPFASRALRLLPTTTVSSNFNYSQVKAFDLSNSLAPADTYLLKMDFMLSGFQKRLPTLGRSVDTFSIILDVPGARRLDFTSNGTNGQVSYNGIPVYVGEFSFDTIHSLRVLIDTHKDQWSVALDEQLLFEGVEFFNPHEVRRLDGIRLHLTDDAMLSGEVGAIIDNIVLIESPTGIPEPSGLALLATAAGMSLFRRNTPARH